MKLTIETVTPEKAASWLEGNTKNRKLRLKTVELYAADMRARHWKMTAEPIKFNCDGTLLDGQHRLAACVLSKVPFETAVARGIDSEAQDVMDCGDRRKFSDALHIAGVKNAAATASVVNALYRLKERVADFRRISHSELMPIYERHSAAIAEVVPFLGGTLSAPAGLLGALMVADPDYGYPFHGVIRTGEPFYKGCAAHTLREKIMRARLRKLSPSTPVLLWTTVHAFNLFKDMQPVSNLQWHSDPKTIDGVDYKNF